MRRPDDALLLDMLEFSRRGAEKVARVSRADFDADDSMVYWPSRPASGL